MTANVSIDYHYMYNETSKMICRTKFIGYTIEEKIEFQLPHNDLELFKMIFVNTIFDTKNIHPKNTYFIDMLKSKEGSIISLSYENNSYCLSIFNNHNWTHIRNQIAFSEYLKATYQINNHHAGVVSTKLYYPKSSQRIAYRIASIIFKAILVLVLIKYINLDKSTVNRYTITLYLVILVLIFTLTYVMRYAMYRICERCGSKLDVSSFQEVITPAYETSELKYKDHPIKDDTGKILGYVTTETEEITLHPEEKSYIANYSCPNAMCDLHKKEINISRKTLLWLILGIW